MTGRAKWREVILCLGNETTSLVFRSYQITLPGLGLRQSTSLTLQARLVETAAVCL